MVHDRASVFIGSTAARASCCGENATKKGPFQTARRPTIEGRRFSGECLRRNQARADPRARSESRARRFSGRYGSATKAELGNSGSGGARGVFKRALFPLADPWHRIQRDIPQKLRWQLETMSAGSGGDAALSKGNAGVNMDFDSAVDMELDNVEFFEIPTPWSTLKAGLAGTPQPVVARSTAADYFDRPSAKLVEDRELSYVIQVSDSEDEERSDQASEAPSAAATEASRSMPAKDDAASRLSKKRIIEMEKRLLEQKRLATLSLLNLETMKRQRSQKDGQNARKEPGPVAAAGSAPTIRKTAAGKGSSGSNSGAKPKIDKRTDAAARMSALRAELEAADNAGRELQSLLASLRKQVLDCEEAMRQQRAWKEEIAQLLASLDQPALPREPPTAIQGTSRSGGAYPMNVVPVGDDVRSVKFPTDTRNQDRARAQPVPLLAAFDEALAGAAGPSAGEKEEGQALMLQPRPAIVHAVPDKVDIEALRGLGLELSFENVQDSRSPVALPNKQADLINRFAPYDPIRPPSARAAALWKMDPFRAWCPFEQGGTCRDTSCKFQHQRDIAASDDAALLEHFRHLEERMPPLSLSEVRHELHGLRARNSTPQAIARILRQRMRPWAQASGVSATAAETFSSHAKSYLLSSLQSTGTKSRRNARYFESRQDSEEFFEQELARNPTDEGAWVEYALSKMQSAAVPGDAGSDPSMPIAATLHVLARALENVPGSEVLWLHYVELYTRVAAEEDIRAVFEYARPFVESSMKMLVMNLRWERSEPAARTLLDALWNLLARQSTADTRWRSQVLVDIVLWELRQPFDQRLGNVLRRVWSRLMALLHRPKRENGDDDVLRGEGREFDKGALCTEGDFAFLLQVFMHCLLYHSAPEDLFCDAPSSFVATRQPILFDPVDADYLLGASGTVEPYLSDIAQVLSDWSALSLHRSEDCSKLESRHLLFLALNAKRLMDGMRRLDLIDSVRSFSSHLRDRKLAFSVDLAKDPQVFFRHRQPHPYNFLDSTPLASFVSLSFLSADRPTAETSSVDD